MSRAQQGPESAATNPGPEDTTTTTTPPTNHEADSIVKYDAVQQEALKRHRMGWQLVQLWPGKKNPAQSDWLQRTYETEEEVKAAFWPVNPAQNIAAPNIGVKNGNESGRLVVLDLDGCDPQIAALALTETKLRDGRPGRPDSHWFYQLTDDVSFGKEYLKGALADDNHIEISGNGHQVVLPPSYYVEGGEYRAWLDPNAKVEKLTEEQLLKEARRAAAFQEIVLLWSRVGKVRHVASLPLVGGLLRAEIDADTIDALLNIAWPTADKTEIRDAINSTVSKMENGEPFSGWRKLREECGEEFKSSIDKIVEWLGVGEADDRPTVITGSGYMHKATTQAWEILKLRNKPEFLFSQATNPVRVEVDEDGRALIKALDVYRMRYHLLEEIRWMRYSPKGDLIKADASIELARNVLATPNAKLPPISTVTVAPVLSPQGEVQTEPGYHAENRSYYMPLPGYHVPDVSPKPTQVEVGRARALLLDELLGNFPFDSEAERANALALLLIPFGRSTISGPTPLHFVEAPERGTGKSLLADVITKLMCGPAGAASITETTDEEEWRKKITTALMSGSPFIYIDNIQQPLKSSNIASALTKTQWKDRILGKSEDVTLESRAVWIVTANNASLSLDIARRSVRIRLNAKVEKPYLRGPEHFKHPNLSKWVDENWGELVWSCLTLWSAWVAAGKPAGEAILGSFEEWASVMGGVLDVAGVPGFLQNRDEFIELATDDRSRWQELARAWWNRFGSDEVRVSDLYRGVAAKVEGFDYPGKKGESSEASRLTKFGIELREMRDVIFGRLQVSVRTVNEKPVYHLAHLDGEKRTSDDFQPELNADDTVGQNLWRQAADGLQGLIGT